MGQKYGQHFLHDQEVLTRIAQLIEELTDTYTTTTTFEIWPGRGALTKYLLEQSSDLLLSEIDTSLKTYLEVLVRWTPTQIVRGDVLQQPFTHADEGNLLFGWHTLIPEKTLVVGNLPYYITSPILRLFFANHTTFPAGIFLIQQEVAEKICRDAQKKSYLRWLVNRTHRVRYAFTVKATSFSPPPKVVSAVIVVEKTAWNELEDIPEDRLLSFLDLASPFKRKTLGKIQKMQQEAFATNWFAIPEQLCGKRLEELGRADMKMIVGT